jgi:outer membrane protein OmpA-like peptidoglycan-associated protein
MTTAGAAGELDRLKILLLRPERDQIESLRRDIDSLRGYVGEPTLLEQATAQILVGALARADLANRRELAAAVAPLVVSAIRAEIRNSRDSLVEALYPLTGRLVRAAVASALNELIARVERRVGLMTSADMWIGQAKSLLTGRPVSEFVVADTSRPRLLRLMLIERGSGCLLADWRGDESSRDRADLVSGMIAAILEFSLQALAGEGKLQTLDFGGREIVLRSSPRTILAAEFAGVIRPRDNARISAAFFDMLEKIECGKPGDARALAGLAAGLETAVSPNLINRRGRAALLGLLVVCALGIVWGATSWARQGILEYRMAAELDRLVENEPRLTGFPLTLRFDHQSRRAFVQGVAPDGTDLALILKQLADDMEPYQLIERIGILPGRQELTAIERKSADTERAVAHLGERLDANAGHTPEALERFMRSTAIFFGTDVEFLQNDQARERLQELARILSDNDLMIRIVGHADEIGTAAGNRELGRHRADKVAEVLSSMGINSSRLAVVSRAASVPITDLPGPFVGGNRRVTFESVYRDEMRR